MIKFSLKKLRSILILTSLTFATTIAAFAQEQQSSGIIPKPVKEVKNQGSFIIKPSTKLFFAKNSKINTSFFNQYLKDLSGLSLIKSTTAAPNGINFLIDTTVHIEPEGYVLDVSPKGINIKACDERGLFYGLQSLTQLIKKTGKTVAVQAYHIEDEPRFAYRGMHLDVARHMFSVAAIKKWLDVLAFYKINTFHWHLTDDQGWRIAIKKYPLLQSIAAFRNETLIGHKRANPHIFDGKRYGGYYTQQEVKDIVKYAAERQITTIPEIEMPGHARAVLAAYPQLGCTGGPYQTATFWGVFDDVFCAGNEETFKFLEDVLDEVTALFPSKYIHIGGDECPKTRWQECPKCQKRIKDEKLKDEHELQSYFIARMEKYLHSKGRKIIGWDEILEGGLAPDATVMSWRGLEGGIAAAKLKHDVIMTPEKFVYLDYYQSLNKTEQIAAGGYLPLQKIYEYEPMPAELTEKEQSYIKGVQANVWTEYLSDAQKAEYMIFPRILALAEMAWSKKEHKNYRDFLARLNANLRFLKGLNYATSFYEITGESVNNASAFKLATDLPNAEIRYTINEAEPTKNSLKYATPIEILKSATIKARLYKNGKPVGKLYEQAIIKSLATGKNVVLANPGQGNYNLDKQILTNGIQGSPLYNNGEWLGFSGTDFEATVDLAKITTISEVGLNTLNYQWQKMHPPKLLTVEISIDNTNFKEVSRQTVFGAEGINYALHKLNPVKARYVKLKATNLGVVPQGYYGAGTKAWLLVDKIRIN
ncbi:glycoside hydrolase family 20 protein [Pedobacter endophyticus]|uniref:beta-N-acetylhexosaminidase n=1 Tax=Pedobacter endophyticus TaxID=2789740 RepID=A0A7S9KY76_9SPHI|nr:glycoside hydrolase family 20 protein [Pedobacter endophyticus]QPH39012.1 family 20 glycosylhydrolase [Pedobacter endophyticus]